MPGKVRFDTAAVRALAAQRVAVSSIRSVAEEIGVSKSGLESLLMGREPYSKTRVKLAAWYQRQRAGGETDVSPKDVDAAIAVIARYVQAGSTPAARERRERTVRERLREVDEPDEPNEPAKRRPRKA
jgi:hypothetical protein